VKVAVVGKGGSGKTTIAGVLARASGREGAPVLALDCDTNPNLGLSLGLGEAVTAELVAIRDAVDSGTEPHATTTEALVSRFGVEASDGVRLAVVSSITQPDPGCP
jgi:CO dehydrogenase maturation factor